MSRKGFTLVEMMVVLSVTLVTAAIGMCYRPARVPVDQEVRLLEAFFLEARARALAEKDTVSVRVSGDEVAASSSGWDDEITLSSGYRFTTAHSFSYNAKGHIKIAKTLKLKTPEGTLKFVFQLGSGTFYVAKA